MPDADVDSDYAGPTVAGRDGPLHLDGERHKPPIGSTADGGGQDAGTALLQPPRQLSRRLVGLEDANAGKLDVLAVRQHLDLPGGEPAGDPRVALVLPAWETHRAALAAAASRVAPVPKRPRERVQAAVVGLLGVLGPPGRHLTLGAVPFPPQLPKRPRHLHVLSGGALIQPSLDQLQAPVICESG